MYHYVRPIKKSKFPNIKGLEIKDFIKQLKYFKNKYFFMSSNEIIDIMQKKLEFPKNGIWLTFDDGLKDHYDYVLPELIKMKITASFFPSIYPIIENKLIDAHSIHFILAQEQNIEKLMYELKLQCKKNGVNEKKFNSYLERINTKDRFDNNKVIFFKRMLQREIDIDIRKKILDDIFKKILNTDTKMFSKKLYLSEKNIKEMVANNMTFGNHTYSHPWLNKLNLLKQEKEIKKSLQYFKKLGISNNKWMMCYPYGAYNKNTLKILKKLNCVLGVTSKVSDVSNKRYSDLELPRYDTNDFL